MRFVPDRDGLLKIQSATPGADQLFVRVTEGQCVDPNPPLACVRYDAATTVTTSADVPLFITVDTYYYQLGTASLHLEWVP